jgi:hypothetical protein
MDVDGDVHVGAMSYLRLTRSAVACPSGGIGTFGGLITKGFGFK